MIASDVEEDYASGMPIPGLEARQTIIFSSKDLPPINLNNIPSQNPN